MPIRNGFVALLPGAVVKVCAHRLPGRRGRLPNRRRATAMAIAPFIAPFPGASSCRVHGDFKPSSATAAAIQSP
jgi:hypothetical protein